MIRVELQVSMQLWKLRPANTQKDKERGSSTQKKPTGAMEHSHTCEVLLIDNGLSWRRKRKRVETPLSRSNWWSYHSFLLIFWMIVTLDSMKHGGLGWMYWWNILGEFRSNQHDHSIELFPTNLSCSHDVSWSVVATSFIQLLTDWWWTFRDLEVCSYSKV